MSDQPELNPITQMVSEKIKKLEGELATAKAKMVVLVEVHTDVSELMMDFLMNSNHWVKTHCRHSEWLEYDKVLGQYGLRMAEITKKMEPFL